MSNPMRRFVRAHDLTLPATAALCLGFAVRALLVLSADFPLNDGGMFYAMARDLQLNGYRLPAVTSYNGAGIPYAYSPLGFYAAALLDAVTPLSLYDTLRVIPLLVSCLTVYAFFLLARDLLPPGRTLAAAVFTYALIPSSFVWMLMGGGLTRSFGFLFAILALYHANRFYTLQHWRSGAFVALFCALTVVSHLGTAPFLAFSIAVFFLVRGRHRRGLIGSVAIALATIALSAPWWGSVVALHGWEPFRAARESGGLGGYSGLRALALLIARLGVGSTHEPFFPMALALALLGAVVSIARRRYLLVAWAAAIILLEYRAYQLYLTLPLSMLAGVGVDRLLRLVASPPPPNGSAAPRQPWRARLSGALPALLAAFLVTYGSAAALVPLKRSPSAFVGEGRALAPLTPDDRAAQRWIAGNTPRDARVLAITGYGWESMAGWVWAPSGKNGWQQDRFSEWLPVLSGRHSVATVQGYEWFPDGVFTRRVASYDRAQRCANWTTECLAEWTVEFQSPFSHVYVPRSPDAHKLAEFQCCQPLLASLRADPRYRLVYEGPGGWIFAVD